MSKVAAASTAALIGLIIDLEVCVQEEICKLKIAGLMPTLRIPYMHLRNVAGNSPLKEVEGSLRWKNFPVEGAAIHK